MSKLVTIFGGSGFIGRYVARRMAKAGWRVRVAVRRPNEAIFVKPYGVVGQVEPMFCNIRDDASVRQALRSADAVVNCVGILQESGRNRFDAVQARARGALHGWPLKLASRKWCISRPWARICRAKAPIRGQRRQVRLRFWRICPAQ